MTTGEKFQKKSFLPALVNDEDSDLAYPSRHGLGIPDKGCKNLADTKAFILVSDTR